VASLARRWTISCGSGASTRTVANICVHYTAASAALRWYNVVIPRDAISALDPFDLESSLRQTDFLFAGRVTTAAPSTSDCAVARPRPGRDWPGVLASGRCQRDAPGGTMSA
jgi:hypothetical protein